MLHTYICHNNFSKYRNHSKLDKHSKSSLNIKHCLTYNKEST